MTLEESINNMRRALMLFEEAAQQETLQYDALLPERKERVLALTRLILETRRTYLRKMEAAYREYCTLSSEERAAVDRRLEEDQAESRPDYEFKVEPLRRFLEGSLSKEEYQQWHHQQWETPLRRSGYKGNDEFRRACAKTRRFLIPLIIRTK